MHPGTVWSFFAFVSTAVMLVMLGLESNQIFFKANATIQCSNTPSCNNFGIGSRQNIVCNNVRVDCTNSGSGSTQDIDCTQSISCGNTGDGSTQSMKCQGPQCHNNGDGSTQKIFCTGEANQGSCSTIGTGTTQSIDCTNLPSSLPQCFSSNGFGKHPATQTTICQRTTCTTQFSESPIDNNVQNTNCNNVGGGCVNDGDHTNVYGSGISGSCHSGAPRTTTICQPGRTAVIPN